MGSKAKLLSILWPSGVLFGGVLMFILAYLLPQYYNREWFLWTYLFFMIIETGVVFYVDWASQKATQRQMVNVYLLTKVVKILLSLAFVAAYAIGVKEGIKSFVLVFMLFYLFFLFIETVIFRAVEKNIKIRDNDKKAEEETTANE